MSVASVCLRGVRSLLLCLVALAQVHGWADPHKHTLKFLTVEPGVQIEVLDYGGHGLPILLLAGSGNTAHVYDDFAEKLLDCCHVYAMTRRGFGHSSHPETGYDDQRLADDVFAVIEGLKIEPQ